MTFRLLGRSVLLNATAAASGVAATFFITWFFGLAEFAYYGINLAKLSVIMLGTELLPSSFTVFRLQDDERFSAAVPLFYLGYALLAVAIAIALIVAGVIRHPSWFMPLCVLALGLQRYFDTRAQARGQVDAYFWIPATTNIVRLALLVGLSRFASVSAADSLWASIAVGSLVGQAVMISRFPEFIDRRAYQQPLAKLGYLWALRDEYRGYYVNSLLKRAKDTFLPLFADLVIPSKAEIGRLLVFTRANEAICGQVRVLEAYLVNRQIREGLRHVRRRIFWTIAPAGQLMVAALALALMYRHGIRPLDVTLALVTGFFIYPYVAEIFWRNDALAAFRPRQVTISLLAFVAGLAVPPLIAWAVGMLAIPVLVVSYVLGQSLSAATYRYLPRSAGRASVNP